MAIVPRRLLKSKTSAITGATNVTPDYKIAKSKEVKAGNYAVKGRSVNIPESKAEKVESPSVKSDAMIETANVGQIRSRDPYGSILSGYLHTDIETSEQQQQGKSNDTTIMKVYRDMYYHDPICGAAINMLSNMPFSDFSLGGAKQAKTYQKFEDSIHNMNIKPLLPTLSTEYLVHGLFISTTIFDDSEGVFTGIIPQTIDYVDVTPVPVYGRDPLITLRIGEAYKNLATTGDERMAEFKEMIGDAKRTLKPEAKDVIYIARRNLLRDYRGVSILRSLLTSWLLERALYRGTIDQSMKRQRAVTHMVAGDQEWTPTSEELNQLADALIDSDLDPVGAIFVTRQGVQVNDIRSAGDMWKVTDLADFFTTSKLRALGISESFISGDASYNSLEQSMSVFIEQMRAYREMISYELFYDRTFPRISWQNDYLKKRFSVETASGEDFDPRQLDMFSNELAPNFTGSFYERASEIMTRQERRDLFIPQVHWHKRLRPEADQEYIGMLNTLQEAGVPIPLRIWAAAGGLDLDSIMFQKDDDISLRNKVKDWFKTIKPVEGGEGGGGLDLSSLANLTSGSIRQKSILDYSNEMDPESLGARNIAGGKRHILSRKGAKVLDERMNKMTAEIASKLGAKVNAIDKKLDERFREMNETIKYYTA